MGIIASRVDVECFLVLGALVQFIVPHEMFPGRVPVTVKNTWYGYGTLNGSGSGTSSSFGAGGFVFRCHLQNNQKSPYTNDKIQLEHIWNQHCYTDSKSTEK